MMKNPLSRKRKAKERGLLFSLLSGTAAGALLAVLLLLVATKIAYESSDPSSLLLPLSLFCSALSAFTAGLVATRLYSRHNALTGLLCGGAFALLILTLSFTVSNSAESVPSLWRYLTYPIMILCACAGGGVTRKRTKKRRRFS